MTEQLEDALSRVFDHAATRAPVPPADLLGRVESGHRKRRKMRLAVSAGGVTAACAAVLGVALVVQNFGGAAKPVADRPETSSPQPSFTPPPQAKPVPMEKLWPNAVHRISNRLPDHRRFYPATLADDRTLLVTVESSFEKASELIAYDLKTHATRKITNVITPAKATGFATNMTVGEGQVVWSTMVKNISQIWTVPVSGGSAVKVAEAPGTPDFLAVADGKAFWSLGDNSGLLQAPLTGGKATPVPGTANEHILTWPWVASPGLELGNGTLKNQVVYKKARNLLTGETRTAKISAPGLWNCGPSLCYGIDSGGKGRAQLRDGTQSRVVPIKSGGLVTDPPSLDRFIFGTPAKGVIVYDFRTGKIGSVPASNTFALPHPPYDRLYPAIVKNGYLIVDLAAIP